MKRSILSVCMLTLLCLLSCDVDALNDLLNEVKEKFLDESKDNKDLNHKQENQEQKEVVIDGFEEEVEIQQDMEVKPVNAGFAVSQQVYSYYVQKEVIKIEEKDLVPSTEYEKEAAKAIKNVEGVIKDFGFPQLVKNARELKSEYEQLSADLHDILLKVQNKLQEKRNFLKVNHRGNDNRIKIQRQIHCLNKFREQLKIDLDLERLMNNVDIAIQDIGSAEFFFERAKNNLKEAITKRLENAQSWRNRLSYVPVQLAGKARSDAESSFIQLESYSRIGEARGRKKEIEKLIEEAKSYLSNLER
ncbi:P12 family lipoprotein [Borrelia turicatae]|uniref:P12 family lipoprotein n=1 Tax=Borrelia turicatae TaxID=142 RepID=UPI002ED618D1